MTVVEDDRRDPFTVKKLDNRNKDIECALSGMSADHSFKK